MELLLITGFLGSGKTTFLKHLIEYWKDRSLALIVNEFGQVNVDGAIFRELGASLREVTGGSVFCSCRLDQFEEALGCIIQDNPEVIAVEASGLSDPTSVRTVLARFPEVRYLGCVALCDAPRLEKAMATVRVCPKQLAVSDLILLNKLDLVSEQEARQLEEMLKSRFPRARVEKTIQADFSPLWLEMHQTEATDMPFEDSHDVTLQKALVRIKGNTSREICESFIKLVYEDTYRIKGILMLAEGVYLVDCVGPSIIMKPCNAELAGLELVFLAGKGMPLRKSLKAARTWYPEFVEDIRFG